MHRLQVPTRRGLEAGPVPRFFGDSGLHRAGYGTPAVGAGHNTIPLLLGLSFVMYSGLRHMGLLTAIVLY